MEKLKIGGKEYDYDVTLGKYLELNKKHPDADNLAPMEYTLDAIWAYLVPKWYGLKPFITKKRMIKAISFKEFKTADTAIATNYNLEDREGEN